MKMITLLILGLVSLVLISNVYAEKTIKYTEDSVEDCVNGKCSLIIHSQPAYGKDRNGNWKDINTLPSLLNTSYFCSITKSLPFDADVTCLDYNFTWMKLEVVFHQTGQIPIREVTSDTGIEIKRQTFNINQNQLENHYIFEIDISKGNTIHIGETSTIVSFVATDTRMAARAGENCAATISLTSVDDPVSTSCSALATNALTNAAAPDDSYVTASSSTGTDNEGLFLRVRANISTTTYVKVTDIKWIAEGKVGDISSNKPDLYMWNFTGGKYYRYSTNPWGLTDIMTESSTKSLNLNPEDFINNTNKKLYWMFEETDTNDVNSPVSLDYVALGIEYTNIYPIIANVTINDTILNEGEEVKFTANISISTVGYINLSRFQVKFPNATYKNFSGTNTGSNTISANTVIKTDSIPSGTNYTAGTPNTWVFTSSDATCRGGSGSCLRYPGSAAAPGWIHYNINLDGSSYNSCNVSAHLRRAAAMDTGDYVCLDWSTDGQFWNAYANGGTAFCLDETDIQDAYVKINSTNFRPSQAIRWRARAFAGSASETGYVDDVAVSCQRRVSNEVWNYVFNETYQGGVYNLTRVMGKDEYLVENSSFVNKGFTVTLNPEFNVTLDTANNTVFATVTPKLNFTGRYYNNTQLEYNVQIDTANTFDSAVNYTLIDHYNATTSSYIMRLDNVKYASQSFESKRGGILKRVTFRLDKTLLPTGNANAKLYAHSGVFGTDSVPTGTALATSNPFNITRLTGTKQLINFTFATPYTLASNTYYVITFELNASGTSDVNNYVGMSGLTTAPTHAGNRATYTSSWTAQTSDTYFKVHVATPTINVFSERPDTGFAGVGDPHPWNSSTRINYTVQVANSLTDGNVYFWRARAMNNATDIWSDWSDGKKFTITLAAGGSCTYVSGDWNLNCADACVISSPVDVGANNIIITGAGNIWFNSAIRAKAVMMPSRTTSCTAHFKAGLN